MYMSSGDSHSAPVDSIVNNGDGTYSCTVYYLMSTKMKGMIAGHWELKVNIGSETATFYPYVDMAMSSNTREKDAQGAERRHQRHDGHRKASYYLFKDDIITGATSTFDLCSLQPRKA